MNEVPIQLTIGQPLLHIGLPAWIIQDGNYPDFERGRISRFALEFYAKSGFTVDGTGGKTPGLLHRSDALYFARGIVRFCADDVWVVDFGNIMAFREERPQAGISPGVMVTGECYLGIDAFVYFATLCRAPGMPPLIYEWLIEEIQMETAPFVELVEETGRKVLVRDHTKLGRVQLAKTDAWNDDDGNADYLLACRRVSAGAS